MKAPFRFAIWWMMPGFRSVLDGTDQVEPASVSMQPRWRSPVVMDFAFFSEVDTKRVEDGQGLWRVRLISNLSEVFAVVTLTAIASTFLNLRVVQSGGFNICLDRPRPEINDDPLFVGN